MRFQVLALSGGGYLGLYAAKLLALLEEAAGKPLGQCFDLICGTSIGGILALGLGAEVSAATLLAQFEEQGEAIFSNRAKPHGLTALLDMRRSLFRAKYSDADLRTTVKTLLEGRQIKDSHHRLLIPAVNMTKGHLQIFKTAHAAHIVVDPHRLMVDVAMATSAAPTYFPLAEVGNALFTDGGLAANAPDLCGVHEAECVLNIRREDIHVLSIGTTTSKFSLAHGDSRSLGTWEWMKGGRLLSTILAAQQQLTNAIMTQSLGARYLRLDEVQSNEQQAALALDVATEAARRTIGGLAEGTYQQYAASPILRGFLGHTAAKPQFFN